MKINFIPTILALAISFLTAYGLYSIHANEHRILLMLGSFVFFAVTLITAFGASFNLPRTTFNLKTLALIFFVIALCTNLLFSFVNFSVQSYIVSNGILLLVFLLITYSIKSAKQ